jgi:Ca2+-binding EF-hand superfamily protein
MRSNVADVREGVDDNKAFLASDTDHSGGISREEMKHVLRSSNYTPLEAVIDEVYSEVAHGEWTSKKELDFMQFFDFMLIFRQRDGFLRREVTQMRRTFNMLAGSKFGKIKTRDLLELFHAVGYPRESLETVEALVDESGAGAEEHNWHAVLRMMRQHRECELQTIRVVFNSFMSPGTLILPRAKLPNALEALRHDSPDLAHKEDLDFDRFVQVVDDCRATNVERLRRLAGFGADEIDQLRLHFDSFDRRGFGLVTVNELKRGFRDSEELRLPSRPEDLMLKLDMARERALEGAVSDVTAKGSSELTFWEYVQLFAILCEELQRREQEATNGVAMELQFSEQETEQFHHIFSQWSDKVAVIFPGNDGAGAGGKSASRESSKSSVTCPPLLQGKRSPALPFSVVRQLVRSLGLIVTSQNRLLLDDKLAELERLGGVAKGTVDFIGFLGLMRWMLDTDFAGINKIMT